MFSRPIFLYLCGATVYLRWSIFDLIFVLLLAYPVSCCCCKFCYFVVVVVVSSLFAFLFLNLFIKRLVSSPIFPHVYHPIKSTTKFGVCLFVAHSTKQKSLRRKFILVEFLCTHTHKAC